MPEISVVTPFYNTAAYLGACIESVLAQSFGDFEYLLVDNASDDGSLEIARDFAKRDRRIRVVHYDALIPQIPNYNRALRLIDPDTRFCKIAQADDLLLPRCLEDMRARAREDEEIGLVCAYTLLQDHVFLDGLEFFETTLPGEELLRRYLQDGPYLLGNPTSHLYRTRDVLETAPFFPETGVIADAEAALRLVLGRRFGFVHQVLSFARRGNESISDTTRDYNINVLTRRVLLEKYGHAALDEHEVLHWRRVLRWRHARVLAEGWLRRRGEPFWDFHRKGLADCGLTILPMELMLGVLMVLGRLPLNLEGMFRTVWSPGHRS